MANGIDLKLVIKHLANGTICENLCRVCLKPLFDDFENIFTKICKEDKEYCIADVLKDMCNIKITDADHYNVCPDCFVAASNAYKFYVNTKCNDELLNCYVDQLEQYLKTINMTESISGESICISLPVISMDMAIFDYDFQNLDFTKPSIISLKKETVNENVLIEDKKPLITKKEDLEIVIIKDEKGQSTFFKIEPDGKFTQVDNVFRAHKSDQIKSVNQANKRRKKREPMTSKQCYRCPIKYRFVAKLKAHMKMEHNVNLYACKVCEALTEDEELHEFHMKTHTNRYKCDICSVTFKKREAIVNHLKDHDETKNNVSQNNNHVCVQCGLIFKEENALNNHVTTNHYKKFACFYCGRVYKGKSSFDKHIEKHETYTKAFEDKRKQEKRTFTTAEAKKMISASEPQSNYTCELCGRSFRGERALLWHSRLHSNERPFKCGTCGRAFVSLNRCNQHALCAHTPPLRRCPLCPARFHLASMVNTHIKKVHLRAHKRRTRAPPTGGPGNAEPVPVQELSVAIQRDILELQAAERAASQAPFY